jgi:predicted ATPase
MRIKQIRILNYKSFSDSEWIELAPGFNVIVGKNSSGKTALLESFRFNGNNNHPHLTLSRRRDTPLPERSNFQLEVEFSENELLDALLSHDSIDFPIRSRAINGTSRLQAGVQLVHEFFGEPRQTLKLHTSPGQGFSAVGYPSHGKFPQEAEQTYIQVRADKAHGTYSLSNDFGGASDNVANLFSTMFPRKVYVFRAERLNIGESGFSEARVLDANAQNLPQVLFSLTTNPYLFDRYNRHVNEIFPYITRVTVFPKGGNLDVRLWWVNTSTEREDLAVPLRESGTGVGQALAILYVAMTMQKGVIAIDEPNSFLHPGAAKKLIEILKQYDHQYIITTHSPEIIASTNPNAIFSAHWNNGDTKVDEVPLLSPTAQKTLLADIGVSAIDVFGADKIIWVEGETEEECFPLILQRTLKAIPPGLDFLAVRSVDEVVRKQGTDDLTFELYRKLSSEAAIVPKLLKFSFDREMRSDEYLKKATEDTKGKVQFLPARHYECFLLNEAALSAILSAESAILGREPVSVADIKDWAGKNADKYGGQTPWTGSIEDHKWRERADAANLLKQLFSDFLLAQYSKTKHSRSLTEWLLDNNPEFLSTLSAYIQSLTILESNN